MRDVLNVQLIHWWHFRNNEIPCVIKRNIRGSVSNPCEGKLGNKLKRKSSDYTEQKGVGVVALAGILKKEAQW